MLFTQVLKNGVRISSDLSYTMGCPTLGTLVFVYPVQKQRLSCLATGNDEPKFTEDNSLVICNCKELYLQLAPLKNGLPVKINNMCSVDFSPAKSHILPQNDSVASPRTPSNGSKFSNYSELSSPVFEDSSFSVPNHKNQVLFSFDVMEALEDESTKKLLQTCAASWLHSRCLLLGNLVTIQIFSELYFFQVIQTGKMSVARSSHYTSNGSSTLDPEDSNIAEHTNQAIMVNRETKVILSLPSNMASDNVQRDLCEVTLKQKGSNAKPLNTISKLGGLSKEYAVLKGIIMSSVKDSLSRYVLSVGYINRFYAVLNPLNMLVPVDVCMLMLLVFP